MAQYRTLGLKNYLAELRFYCSNYCYEDSDIVIEVADDGPGIPPEVTKNIFDPFFTTKEAGKGTGLGLSIVNTIIEGFGGKIFVESEPDQGTVFTIRLPVD